MHKSTLKSAALASGLNCLWAWYPFKKDSGILIAGSDYENDLEMLRSRAKFLDEYNHISKDTDVRYDYIILSDYGVSCFKDKADYRSAVSELKKYLKPDGIFLFALNNRIGVKYICGEPDATTGIPFDNISDNNGAYRFSRNELKRFLKDLDFKKIKFYYPFPDCVTPQLIYTDEYPPSTDIIERLKLYISNSGSRVLNEYDLLQYLAENDELLTHANSFIAECGLDLNDIVYCSMTPDRRKENAFITRIREKTVEKIPMFDDGIKSIERLYENLNELKKRGIPLLDIEIKDNTASMRRVNATSLSKYIRTLNKEEIIKCVEKLYDFILMSSEHTDAGKNKMLIYDNNADWGPILKTAYIEMIPVNCFYENGNFLFFDQEYTLDNCPAKFVLFRALNDIYRLVPETENIFSFDEMKKYFKITELWDYFQKEENSFWSVRMCNGYEMVRDFLMIKNNDYSIRQNRKVLQMYNGNKEPKEKINDNIFDSVNDLNGKKVILFGAGKLAECYMKRYGEKHPPVYMIDNSPDKAGQSKYGLTIYPPDKLYSLDTDEYRVIITSGGYEEIAGQLEKAGITTENYRIFNRRVDALIPAAITDTMTNGKYNTGYVTGAFDLFHIGHINLFKKCKERCHYLIVGVLTDHIIKNEKNKMPFVPFEERIEIVKQCRYVDRVIPVDSHNTNKIDAWRELRYGCLFSGSDHENDSGWLWLQKQLRTLGSELEFFPYTQSTSSTMLQKAIMEKAGN